MNWPMLHAYGCCRQFLLRQVFVHRHLGTARHQHSTVRGEKVLAEGEQVGQVTEHKDVQAEQRHPSLSDLEVQTNQVGIQMLYDNLHQQIFENEARPAIDDATLQHVVRHLTEHGLWGKASTELPAVPLNIPQLNGGLDAHFRSIAEEMSLPYRKLAENLACEQLPAPPSEWAVKPGWTKYCSKTGETKPVDFPTCSGLVFDVEVLMAEGQYPTMATAASPDSWYSWCSPRVFSPKRKSEEAMTLHDLISLETSPYQHSVPGNQWPNRIVLGHNVSFDRSFIKEQYYIKGPHTKFIDTMSLHIAVCGLTSTQRILYQARKKGLSAFNRKEIREKFRPEQMKSFQWSSDSTLNNLQDVHQLYCPDKEQLTKATRDVFVKGNMQDVREQFQDLMSYCASDVQATHEVFQKLWPEFLERFPHPVTFAGMLEMSTVYLPITSAWQRYIQASDDVYRKYQDELRDTLMQLANEACEQAGDEKYKSDLWLWDLDWKPKKVRLKGRPKQVPIQFVKTKQGVKVKKVKQPPIPTVTYPQWFADLVPSPDEVSEELPFGPSKISTLRRCTPKLLRLTWKGYPVHYDDTLGWGYLKPTDGATVSAEDEDCELIEELMSQEEEYIDEGSDVNKEHTFPLNEYLEYCRQLPSSEKRKPNKVSKVEKKSKVQSQITVLEKQLEESQDEDDKFRLLKQIQTLEEQIKKTKARRPQSSNDDGSHDIGIPFVRFYPLPHKDGPKNRVGNPLSKDFLAKIEDGVMRSAAGDHINAVLKLANMCSYWKNNMKRVKSQIDLELPWEALPTCVQSAYSSSPDKYVGAIIPRLVTAGTVTRRAVEATWLTASNAYPDRIGSELKSMVQSPPGYRFVGADVDSQELWIAAVMGDSYAGGIHGCTALGWMTLQGSKAAGTDLHSKVAVLVGITRDQAKVFNYGRIYGAGQSFARQLLLQFNHDMPEQEAQRKAREMYEATKGKRFNSFWSGSDKEDEVSDDPQDKLSGRWYGGSESAMFNKLESVIVSDQPRTPVLGCRISKALEPGNVNQTDFMTSRVNWVVQSSAVDYLHLMLVCMKWLIEKYHIDGRFSISIHDEVRYLVTEKDSYRAALALQITNLLTRAMFAQKLGMNDLPQSVAFFSSADIDRCLRKEVNLDCKTPSNPDGMEKGYNIPHGESLSVYEILEKTGGSLCKENFEIADLTDTMEYIDFG